MDYTTVSAFQPLVTVVETPEFARRADKLFAEEERDALILYLAAHPAAGVVIPGTGGIRKLRWPLAGRGKRGGARVIYFFCNASMPVFALTVFAKSERADLSREERGELRELVQMLIETYGRRGHEQSGS